jgi:hypothetical protein
MASSTPLFVNGNFSTIGVMWFRAAKLSIFFCAERDDTAEP